MFGFFEPREMRRFFAARGISCVKRVHAPGGNKSFDTSKKWLKPSRGMFAYDSITVSSAWELVSVSMCYSQGDGVNTPCLGVCTVPTSCVRLCSLVVPFLSCVLCGYLSWHGHVLPGTKVIKIMCVNQL